MVGQHLYITEIRALNAARNAVHRCADPGNARYGGRGIKVYEPWVEDIHTFKEYLLTLPGCDDPELMLDRIDNDGHYEPGNLRYTTHVESAQSEAVERKRNKVTLHLVNCEYVAMFHEKLREVRGTRSQMLIACMADVVQSYISRVESGTTNGIGPDALHRILKVYREIDNAN